jgi:hypothetical protein
MSKPKASRPVEIVAHDARIRARIRFVSRFLVTFAGDSGTQMIGYTEAWTNVQYILTKVSFLTANEQGVLKFSL